ncbi:MAG: tetratricopeptide repeat protein [Bacteroidota bacterium]
MTSGMWQRILVIVVGLILTGLLFFANKTNLESSSDKKLTETTDSGLEEQSLPPLAPEPKVDSWIDSLNFAKESEKIRILDSIVLNLQARNRFDYAALYAESILVLDSSLHRVLLAGELNQKAMRMPFVQKDSVMRTAFSTKSINLLQQVTASEPTNERALLSLGLALTESGVPQQSMAGIQTLRRILDINPSNADASFQLGLFSAQTGQFEKAIERFERVLEVDPGNLSARYHLARSSLQTGEVQTAKKLLGEVVDATKDADLKQAANFLLQQLN